MRRKNDPKTDPAALTVRVWVIEGRWQGEPKGSPYDGWVLVDVFGDEFPESEIVLRCSRLSEEAATHDCRDREFRYRLATLTFDDDGRKCVIY